MVVLEGILKAPQPQLLWAACLPPYQAAQGPVQLGLEYLRGWGTTDFLDRCVRASLLTA